VADPFDIVRFLSTSAISPRLSPSKVVTVLDSDLWEGRDFFGPLFFNQIKAADLLLFNKIDLLPEDRIPEYLKDIRDINADCSIIPTYHCQVDPAVLWPPVIEHLQKPAIHLHHFQEHGSAEELGYVTFAFEETTAFESDCFRRLMKGLPLELYRVKGFALLNDKRFFLNHVGGKTEWTELEQPGPTKLAFVGWKVDENKVLEQLKSCLGNE
jgi:G3E family GTPase